MTTLDAAPAIPPRFRTVAYFVALIVGGLTTLATGLTAAVAPEAVGTVIAVCGAVTSAVSLVVGGLGVAFRPTVGLPSARPARIGGDTWGDGTPVDGPVIGDAPVYAATAEFLAPEIR